MPILPNQFDSTPVAGLLSAAGQGLVGFDARLIRSLLAREAETLDELDRLLAQPDPDALVDLAEQIFDIYRHLATPRALPFYMDLLKRGIDNVPDELTLAIAALGEAAIGPLLDFHAQADADDKPDIVFLLAALGVHDARIQALVEAALQADCYEGALCANVYGDPALKPAIEAAIAAGPHSAEERKALDDCLNLLSGNLKDVSARESFDIYAEYPEEAAPLFDHMRPEQALDFLSCEIPTYRQAAALSFIDEDYSAATRDQLLKLAAGDAEENVRAAACMALGESLDQPEVRAFLFDILRRKDAGKKEWTGTLVALAPACDEPEVHAAIVAAYEDQATRASALNAMWRSLNDKYRRYFRPALHSDDEATRYHAVQGVGAFPIPELAMELVPLLADEDLRETALFSYALAVPHKTTPKSVGRLFEIIDEKAGGLSASEEDSVATALDQRLMRLGYEPVYFPEDHDDHDHDHEPAEAPPAPAQSQKVGRNDACPCGSGKKYKKCCGA